MAFNKNGKWYGAGLVLVGAVIGVALVSAGTSVVHWSGSTEFCGTFCHSMDAAYASYKKGQHAQTFSGAKAECVDCHLKYESVHHQPGSGCGPALAQGRFRFQLSVG